MNTYAHIAQRRLSRSNAHNLARGQSKTLQKKRTHSIPGVKQRKLAGALNTSARTAQLKAFHEMANQGHQAEPMNQMENRSHLLGTDEEELLQRKPDYTLGYPVQRKPISGSQPVIQRILVTYSDIGNTYKFRNPKTKKIEIGNLVKKGGGGWYRFLTISGHVSVQGASNIISKVGSKKKKKKKKKIGLKKNMAISGKTFSAGGIKFKYPGKYKFTSASALRATKKIPRGRFKIITGRNSKTGVKIGDIGSYGAVQHLEKVGDQLTGDHQPSGAAIKEAIRLQLHTALNQPLTRSMARYAYKRAITIVMTDVWHKASSRTYGGRNTKQQILKDAGNLLLASIEDWKKTVPELLKSHSKKEVKELWEAMDKLRQIFFKTGEGQWHQ